MKDDKWKMENEEVTEGIEPSTRQRYFSQARPCAGHFPFSIWDLPFSSNRRPRYINDK